MYSVRNELLIKISPIYLSVRLVLTKPASLVVQRGSVSLLAPETRYVLKLMLVPSLDQVQRPCIIIIIIIIIIVVVIIIIIIIVVVVVVVVADDYDDDDDDDDVDDVAVDMISIIECIKQR